MYCHYKHSLKEFSCRIPKLKRQCDYDSVCKIQNYTFEILQNFKDNNVKRVFQSQNNHVLFISF